MQRVAIAREMTNSFLSFLHPQEVLNITLQSLCQRKLLWPHKFFSSYIIWKVVDTQEKAHYDATLPLLKGYFTNILFLGKSHIFNSNVVWYSWSINGIGPEESLNSNFVCFKYVPKNLDSRLTGPCDLGAASWGPLRHKSRSYVAPWVEVPGEKIACGIILRRIPLVERDPKTKKMRTFFIRKGFKKWNFLWHLPFSILNGTRWKTPFHKSKIQLQKNKSEVNLKYFYFYIYGHFSFCPWYLKVFINWFPNK